MEAAGDPTAEMIPNTRHLTVTELPLDFIESTQLYFRVKHRIQVLQAKVKISDFWEGKAVCSLFFSFKDITTSSWELAAI